MHILVFDSGLGGLTVYDDIRKLRPDARYTYLADDAVFPYGRLEEDALVARVQAVVGAEIARSKPDICVIACNTASTLVLPHLRAAFSIPFVGTVPAVKPAGLATRSKLFSVLATPGTVRRDYTRGLIEQFAAGCAVTLVGCPGLAGVAEAKLRGTAADRDVIAAEIAPAFVEVEGRRTDVVVLACTHYPLLMDELAALAPWPVTWIDPAPAIAKRVTQLVGKMAEGAAPGAAGRALFTSGRKADGALVTALAARGLAG